LFCLWLPIVGRKNLLDAYYRVVRNKGSCGLDGVKVEDLRNYLQENWSRIKEELMNGTYQPQP